MPQVGGKKYAYTKKGKAAAAKAKRKQKRKGPMPKVNPEFAKEMEEGNKPKPLPYKKKEIGAHPHLGPQGPVGEELKKVLARRKRKAALKKKTTKKKRLDPQSRHFRGRG